ncbi:serine O-acetyltransferase [Neptunomonas phycophila]|jgi:serine O-acetyltransferase|uniref:Serine acetyltransferase n=1 Tax=Neptunomonas phycophila TaxID=1572645 RepID=A0AAW7XM03_9GAMM|nr:MULTISPECIES: serine O-acetyltransferase [Neptunomonas]MBT3144760.1 serine O-acetyltransferase [Neptunomonas phycophila]MDN2660900.1 serine O-acetyltransferase [Neptunomonas sp. CHC150]MDO6453840.1 serine O-acetyltransferase [Neptunomonas phycophila]MDO6467849.1 serine O-acetyltransferase [Neptunomonas phycophila]MDO6783893.1 serine O-acetyltransferase [Neptunomonas phycophila]
MTNLTIAPADLWLSIQKEAQAEVSIEPFLASFYHSSIINHNDLQSALSFILASKLADDVMSPILLRELLDQAMATDPFILNAACLDIIAVHTRDPAVDKYSTVLLYLKGFHALLSHRVAHWLWGQGRRSMASYIQSRVSSVFQVDIHPAAIIGSGVMFDHATGIVVGETCVIENDVSILQSVTLGGTGNETGDRHPKIREGVLIGAGAKIFGNIEVGKGAKVGGGSVVLDDVPPCKTVVGVPARVVGSSGCDKPALDMNQRFDLEKNDDVVAK